MSTADNKTTLYARVRLALLEIATETWTQTHEAEPAMMRSRNKAAALLPELDHVSTEQQASHEVIVRVRALVKAAKYLAGRGFVGGMKRNLAEDLVLAAARAVDEVVEPELPQGTAPVAVDLAAALRDVLWAEGGEPSEDAASIAAWAKAKAALQRFDREVR